jgi:hypothetical protein
LKKTKASNSSSACMYQSQLFPWKALERSSFLPFLVQIQYSAAGRSVIFVSIAVDDAGVECY